MDTAKMKAGMKVNHRSGDTVREVRILGVTEDGRVLVHGHRFAAAVRAEDLYRPYRTGRRVKER